MIKKFLALLLFILALHSITAYATEYENDFSYEEFISQSKKYEINGFDIENDTKSYSNAIDKLISLVFKEGINHTRTTIKTFGIIIVILIISSILNTLVTSESVAKSSMFACYIICSIIIGLNFKTAAQISIDAIGNLSDYMNISFPGFAVLLASGGYGSTANAMQGIFIIISNIISLSVNSFIVPVLYSSALLSLANGVADSGDINNFIKTIIKYIKYIIGIILTVFSAIIGFTGFAASSSDGIALKTAKYAMSNFVPLVGGCLADTLNSVIYTSSLIKSTVGYIGVFVIFMICLVPVTKIFIISFLFKFTSFAASVLTHKTMANTIETVCMVITTFGALLLLLSVVFIMIIGVIVSIGG